MYIRKRPVERTQPNPAPFKAAVDVFVRTWIPATALLLSCAVTPAQAKTDVRRYDWAPQNGWLTTSIPAPSLTVAQTVPAFAFDGDRTSAAPSLDVRRHEWSPSSAWITGQAVTPVHRADVYDTGGRTTDRARLDVRSYDWAPQPAWITTNLPAPSLTTAQIRPALDAALSSFRTRDVPRLNVRSDDWSSGFGIPQDDPRIWPFWEHGGRTPARPGLDPRTYEWSTDQAPEIANVFPRISTLIDDFNRADQGPPLSANWSTQTGVGMVVVSNQATAASGTLSTFERYDAASYGPDHDFFVTVATTPGAGHLVALYGRMDASTNGYAVAVVAATPDIWVIQRIDAGTGTTIGAGFTQDLSAGDKIGLRCQGTSIEAWYQPSGGIWTRLAARTDATYSAYGKTGLACQGTVVRLDDLGGGTINGLGPATYTTAQLADIWATGGLTLARPRLDVRSYEWSPQPAWIFNATPVVSSAQNAGLWEHGSRTVDRPKLDVRGYDWAPQPAWFLQSAVTPVHRADIYDTGGLTGNRALLDVRAYEWKPQSGWQFVNLPAGGPPSVAQTMPAIAFNGGRTAGRRPLDVRTHFEAFPLFGVPDDPANWPVLWETGGRTAKRPDLDPRYDPSIQPAWLFLQVPVVTAAQEAGLWEHGGRTADRPRLDVRTYDWTPQPAWLFQLVPPITTAQFAENWHHGGLTGARPPLDVRLVEWSPAQSWITVIVPVATVAQTMPAIAFSGSRVTDRARLDIRAFEWTPQTGWNIQPDPPSVFKPQWAVNSNQLVGPHAPQPETK